MAVGHLLPLILKRFHKSFRVVMRCFRLHKFTPTAQPDSYDDTTARITVFSGIGHTPYISYCLNPVEDENATVLLNEHNRKNSI